MFFKSDYEKITKKSYKLFLLGKIYHSTAQIENKCDLLGQNCIYNPLHPGSSGIQAHLSAVLQSSSAKQGKKEKSGNYYVNLFYSQNLVLNV